MALLVYSCPSSSFSCLKPLILFVGVRLFLPIVVEVAVVVAALFHFLGHGQWQAINAH